MHVNGVSVLHRIKHPPAIDLKQCEERAVIDAARILQAAHDGVNERPVSNRLAELSGLAVFKIRVNLVEIAGKAGKVHDVGLGDRAGGGYQLVADFEILEVAASGCSGQCHRRSSLT